MWRPAEGTRAYEGCCIANRDGRKCRIVARSDGVGRERALHDRVKICITSTQEDVLSDPVLHFALDALRAESPGINRERVGSLLLKNGLQGLLLLRCEIGQKKRDEAGAYVFNLIAEFVVKVSRPEQDLLAEQALLHPSVIGTRTFRP